MKVLNIVLSILILVLSIASAVFSYFLFEKRTQFVQGWEKLTYAIYRTAGELDKKSGTSIAQKLSSQELSHEKFAELDQHLRTFPEQGRKVIVQRDALADALVRIGHASGFRPDGEAMRKLSSTEEARNEVVNGVLESIRARDQIYSRLSKICKGLNITVNENGLKKGDKAALNSMERGLNTVKNNCSAYERALGDIAAMNGGKFIRNNTASAEKVVTLVKNVKRERERLNDELGVVKSELAVIRQQVSKKDSELQLSIARLNERNRQINGYKKALGIADKDPLPIPWMDGSAEARAQVCGKVITVNEKYGYIGINLGTNSVVVQKIGNSSIKVNPQIKSGLEMIVARGKMEDKPKFLTRIKLGVVGSDSVTADIPEGAPEIETGDIVFFPAK